MKNKWLLTFITVLLLSCYFAYFDGNSVIGDQTISAKIAENSILPEFNQNASSWENVTSADLAITLKNPTFQKMRDFILKDTTSRNQFILNEYECRHFATDVNNNADTAGIRCAFVLLCYRNSQHAVVAFETTDRGMIYIEPQTDAAIQPIVGGQYQGEEIIDILVCW